MKKAPLATAAILASQPGPLVCSNPVAGEGLLFHEPGLDVPVGHVRAIDKDGGLVWFGTIAAFTISGKDKIAGAHKLLWNPKQFKIFKARANALLKPIGKLQ